MAEEKKKHFTHSLHFCIHFVITDALCVPHNKFTFVSLLDAVKRTLRVCLCYSFWIISIFEMINENLK